MKNQTNITTGQTIELKYGAVKISKPINAPKLNSVMVACQELSGICSKSATHKLSGFGHKLTAMNGIIDTAILSGNCATVEQLVMVLFNSNEQACIKVHNTYNNDATIKAHFAHRIKQHVAWCATNCMTHGSFVKHLMNVNLAHLQATISPLMLELSGTLDRVFKVEYSLTYRNRKVCMV